MRPDEPALESEERRPRFSRSLERWAQEVGINRWDKPMDVSPRGMLEREIALTLDQIGSIRRNSEARRQSLLTAECQVDTHLMQLDPRSVFQPEHHYLQAREKLRARLAKIDEERRDLALSEEKDLQQLHTRLLGLLNRHTMLIPPEKWTSKNWPEKSNR